MKTKHGFRGFFGVSASLPLALAVLLMFAVSACDNEPNSGNGPTKYTVSFNANGGTVSPSNVKVESGKTVVSLPTPAKTSGDTVFWGWYTKNGSTGGDWGSPFTTATPVTADITVYARWENTAPPTLYTVTFDADGGTVTPANKQVISGDPVGDLPVPSKPSNTFSGWYTARNGGGSKFTSETTVDRNVTVYANWTVKLSINVQLTEANWEAILMEIGRSDKYVDLDLSLCTRSDEDSGGGLRSDGTFDPISGFSTGKYRIVSLILPNAATSIERGWDSFSPLTSVSGQFITIIGNGAFEGFLYLTSIDFPAVDSIGEYAFCGCNNLTSANFPKATSIGNYAFSGCGLTSASFPEVLSIGNMAFAGCSKLANVSLPKVTSFTSTVGSTFSECISLISVSISAAASIEINLFFKCPSLVSFIIIGEGSLGTIENGKALVQENKLLAYPSASGNITLNNITSIGEYAFYGLTNLTGVSLPSVNNISGNAFEGCSSLTSVSLPAVTNISDRAFSWTEATALTIILGSTAPRVGMYMFSAVNSAKTVTVKVPAGATGYGPIPRTYSGVDQTESWGNGFRGGGWRGSYVDASSLINRYITLHVEYQ